MKVNDLVNEYKLKGGDDKEEVKDVEINIKEDLTYVLLPPGELEVLLNR